MKTVLILIACLSISSCTDYDKVHTEKITFVTDTLFQDDDSLVVVFESFNVKFTSLDEHDLTSENFKRLKSEDTILVSDTLSFGFNVRVFPFKSSKVYYDSYMTKDENGTVSFFHTTRHEKVNADILLDEISFWEVMVAFLLVEGLSLLLFFLYGEGTFKERVKTTPYKKKLRKLLIQCVMTLGLFSVISFVYMPIDQFVSLSIISTASFTMVVLRLRFLKAK